MDFGNITADGENSTILFQGGNNIDIFAMHGYMNADDKGKITFNAGNGDDEFHLANMSAKDGGNIEFNGGVGIDTFEVIGPIIAKDGGTISFNGGAGNDTFDFRGTFETSDEGKISINGGAGADEITIKFDDGASVGDPAGGTIHIDGGTDREIDIFHIYADNASGTIIFADTFSGGEDVLKLYDFEGEDLNLDLVGSTLKVTFGDGDDAITFIFENSGFIAYEDDAAEAYKSLTDSGQINFV